MDGTGTADPSEIEKFDALAEEWWDLEGKYKPLHMLNPCRLDFINNQVRAEFGCDSKSLRPFEGLALLDIGCGGGLLAEPMARLGATVTGIDPAARNIPVARRHAELSGLDIEYICCTAEDALSSGREFDVVLCMEVIEHVPDPAEFVRTCAALAKPGGLLVFSTISRTFRSFALAIVGAERVLRWLPKGTHDWNKFIKPDELSVLLADAGLEPVDWKGFIFNPFGWEWKLSASDLAVNYAAASVKRDEGNLDQPG